MKCCAPQRRETYLKENAPQRTEAKYFNENAPQRAEAKSKKKHASTVNRTQGLQIFSLTLSQLSYRGSQLLMT
jgi:hypothetical protein